MDDGLVIETSELGKRYDGPIVAVDRLSLRVRRGEVYGFLGPNGAGKTTTLRMLLGLVRPTSGGALVLGAPPGSPESLVRVGALIESPTFYPFLSGRDNLRVLARYSAVSETRVEAVLDEVDLAARAGDRFGTYSLGMKQRLGIAGALLKDPELLILDEPTNGMDPAGMAEMRCFIRSLGQDRRTVLLSSHLMSEVEDLCDRVAIVTRGRVVYEGALDELIGTTAGRYDVRTTDDADAAMIARRAPGIRGVTLSNKGLSLEGDESAVAHLSLELAQAGIGLRALVPRTATLEELFFRMTEGPEAALAPPPPRERAARRVPAEAGEPAGRGLRP
jgi:ABC-2 type transport system ATP-binding protein